MLRKLAPGVVTVTLVAAAAWFAAPALRPLVALDAVFLALLLGLAVGAATRHPTTLDPGAQKTLKLALLWGVVLLGAEVNLALLVQAGAPAIALAAGLIALTLASFYVLGRLLGLTGDTWALLGAGTGICGLSAVVATGASLKSREEDVAVAVASIGILSGFGFLLYPVIGALLELPVTVYGAWAGLGVHAIANAIAAGFAGGDTAGALATVTKLTRVALLAPTLILLTFLVRRKAEVKGGFSTWLPPMVWGFLLVVLLTTFLPENPAIPWLKLGAKMLLVLSMAALGYTTRLGHFTKAGPRGIALAIVGWVILSVAALGGAWVVYG